MIGAPFAARRHEPVPADRPHVVFVCTGNAARSVMAAVVLRELTGHYHVSSAGTHVVEGQVMSQRTRAALARVGLADPHHRSRQFGSAEAAGDLILTMEPAHVRWVRRHWPDVAGRTTSLRRVLRLLEDRPAAPAAGAGAGTALGHWVRVAGLADEPMEGWEEVVDPAGGEQEAFDRCVDEMVVLVERLARLLP